MQRPEHGVALGQHSPKFALPNIGQIDDPIGQPKHIPARQTATAPMPALQLVPQRPQCRMLTRRFVSQPVLGFMSQSSNPDTQARPHVPPEHMGAALGGDGQALPHPPQ